MENQPMQHSQPEQTPEQTNELAKRVQQLSVETARAQSSAERALSEAEQARFEAETWRESAHSHGRSLSGLWIVFVLLVLALGGAAWYSYGTAQGLNNRFAAFPDFEQTIQSVSDRVQAAEGKLDTWAGDWKGLGDRVSGVETRVRSNFQLARNFAREQANEVHRQLLAEIDNRTEWLQAHMMRMESAQETQRARIAELEEELASVRAEVREEMSEQVAQVRRDTGREMDGLHTRVAGTRSDLDAMARQLDHHRVNFELTRNQTEDLVPGISITLKNTNVPYQRVEEGWVHVVPDGRIFWIRSQGIQQPMVFYTEGDSRPYHLVFTRLTQDGAVGYLVHPGGPPVAASARGPLAGEGEELSASASEAR